MTRVTSSDERVRENHALLRHLFCVCNSPVKDWNPYWEMPRAGWTCSTASCPRLQYADLWISIKCGWILHPQMAKGCWEDLGRATHKIIKAKCDRDQPQSGNNCREFLVQIVSLHKSIFLSLMTALSLFSFHALHSYYIHSNATLIRDVWNNQNVNAEFLTGTAGMNKPLRRKCPKPVIW